MVRVFVILAASLNLAGNVAAQPFDFREVDAAVEQFLQLSLASGVGVIITTPQAVAYEKVYGNAESGEVIELLSATKMPSTTAILTLVGEGRLGLDDRVGDYIPNWPDDKQTMTIRHCLSCTAGFAFIPPRKGDKTLEEQVADLARERLLFPPGELFSYSGGGFQVAGRVAEIVSGQPWNDFYRDRIAVPLNLKTFDYGSPGGVSLGGGATCDLQDYATILRLHLNNGRHESRQILSSELTREMREDQVGDRRMLARLYPFGFRYGLSWWITMPTSRHEPFVYSDQGATGATPWIDTQRRYGAFLYLKGLAQNYIAAARLWRDVADAINEQFDINVADDGRSLQR